MNNQAYKDKTRMVTRLARQRGELPSKPCEVCGSIKVEAHHVDYAKPMEIRWFCFKHHREHHESIKPKIDKKPRIRYTTISLSNLGIVKQAKLKALENGITLQCLIENMLKQYLS